MQYKFDLMNQNWFTLIHILSLTVQSNNNNNYYYYYHHYYFYLAMMYYMDQNW